MNYRQRTRQLRTQQTDAERQMWRALRNRKLAGYKFRRQHAIPPYIVDFVCLEKRLIVELDGGQHLENQASDHERTQFLERQGYCVLRFWNDEVFQRLDDVLEMVLRHLEISPSP